MVVQGRHMQHEFIADLEAEVPKYLVVVKSPILWGIASDSDKSIFEWINPYIAKHFIQVGLVDTISPKNTVYVWGYASHTYHPKSKMRIYIFKRRY